MLEAKLTKVYIALQDLYEGLDAPRGDVQDALQRVHEKVEGMIEQVGDQMSDEYADMDEDVEDALA